MKRIAFIFCCIIAACSSPATQEGDNAATGAGTEPAVAETVANTPVPANTGTAHVPTETRRLRYLHFANGGLLGFYSDGTVAGCPRCELVAGNIEAMKDNKPHAGYKLENGKIILTDGEELTPRNQPGNTPEWALIDYKWQIQVED